MEFGKGGAWLVQTKYFEQHGNGIRKSIPLVSQGEGWVNECVKVGYTVEFLNEKVISWASQIEHGENG